MRKLNNHLIKVAVNGVFTDINERQINYRVQVELPNCIDEWLKSNIKNRYLLTVIKQGKEFDGKTLKENLSYLDVREIKTINIEEENIVDTNKVPSFYNRSILDFDEKEVQDFATAFGIHSVETKGEIDNLRKQAIVGYLKVVKGLNDQELKQYSFYKYDKARMKHYFDFSELDKNKLLVTEGDFVSADYEKEFKQNDEVVESGSKDIGDLFSGKKVERVERVERLGKVGETNKTETKAEARAMVGVKEI